MCFCVPSDRQLIQGAIDKEQDLSQMKNPFFISQICCYHGGTVHKWFCCQAQSYSHVWRESWHFVQSSYIINFSLLRLCQQISWDGSTWWWGRWFFYHLGRKKSERKPKKERCTYLSLHCLCHLMEQWRTLSPLLVLSFCIFMGGRQSFQVMSQKIMFMLSYIQGGKAQYWKNEAINLIAARQEPFKNFKDFIAQ